ncbi:hypothetical protein CRM22_005961 [Opisthorchis felineus]|uniref:Uncharacterized protein n=1 Tax=Opisthorchis felineus TaxID=147828 RepID=A0A4S2LNK7_OPIFE|nr:hypothetical protein CRM22_005961 [Opisthorchis felineus]
MKLRRFLLRYYPPGIILEYEQGGTTKTKSLDLLDLTFKSNTNEILNEICEKEALVTEKRKPQVYELIERLKAKLVKVDKTKFGAYQVLRAHILPLTNVAFNKSGSHFITGSYDRTCKIWQTESGEEVHTLEGHRNVVYAIAFNLPFSDKIATGSFDKTARLWSAETGECHHVFQSHSAEVVCLQFNPVSTILATGGMDTLAKLWDIETGTELASLSGHTAEVIALQFSQGSSVSSEGDSDGYSDTVCGAGAGRLMLTGSFDHTVSLWDVRSGERTHHLIGHAAEVAAAAFSFDASLVATASMDKTVRVSSSPHRRAHGQTSLRTRNVFLISRWLKCCLRITKTNVWDTRTGRQLHVLTGHLDEVLDVTFDASGRRLVSASADSTSRVWDLRGSGPNRGYREIAHLTGHDGEVSKVCFNSRGTLVLTASADKTARLWDAETGQLKDILVGHTDEVFSCAFNYEGDTIITGSKDNTCRIWR